MIKSLKKFLKETHEGIRREMREPVMPTYGKRNDYNDLKIMDGRKSIIKGVPQK